MSKAPSFPLYAADFYMDTMTWDIEEIGIYFRLLMFEWVNGPLPFDLRKLNKIASTGSKKFSKRWPNISSKFTPTGDGFLINRRLEQVRSEQEEYRKRQQIAGLKSAEIKKSKGIFPFDKSNDPSNDPSNQNQTSLKPESNSSSSLSLSSSLGITSFTSVQEVIPLAPSLSSQAPEPPRPKRKARISDIPKREPEESPEDFHDRYMVWARGKTDGLLEKERENMEAAYPAINLDSEIGAAMIWLRANPQKRKTNVGAFLTNWLKKAQQKGGGFAGQADDAVTRFDRLKREGKL